MGIYYWLCLREAAWFELDRKVLPKPFDECVYSNGWLVIELVLWPKV